MLTTLVTLHTFVIFDIFKFDIPNNKSKFKATIIVQIAIFDLGNQSKSISRKIRVAGKLLNLHTVQFHETFCQINCKSSYII